MNQDDGQAEARANEPLGHDTTASHGHGASPMHFTLAPQEPIRVLVVEDDDDAARILGDALAFLGHDVVQAGSASEALELARSRPVHVALLDIGLPDMDGYALARAIRAMPGPTPALVALTGYGMVEDRLRAKQAGFIEHLLKPVDLKQLRGVVAELGAAHPRRA